MIFHIKLLFKHTEYWIPAILVLLRVVIYDLVETDVILCDGIEDIRASEVEEVFVE